MTKSPYELLERGDEVLVVGLQDMSYSALYIVGAANELVLTAKEAATGKYRIFWRKNGVGISDTFRIGAVPKHREIPVPDTRLCGYKVIAHFA